MWTKSLCIAASALTLLALASPAAAQTPPSTGGSSPQISPIRVEFTRPGGMPGSARSTATQSEFMIAPGQPQTGVAKKKKP